MTSQDDVFTNIMQSTADDRLICIHRSKLLNFMSKSSTTCKYVILRAAAFDMFCSCCCLRCVYIKSSYMMSLEGFVNKCLVPADAGHRPNLAVYGHCRDRPRPLDPHEMAHGPGGPVDTSVRDLAGATTGRCSRHCEVMIKSSDLRG